MSFTPATATILQGTLASRPSPNPQKAGRMYYAHDSQLCYRDTGAAWLAVGVTPNLTLTPPSASSFTVMQTAANFSVRDSGGICLFEGTRRVSGDDRGIAYQAIPTASVPFAREYNATIGFRVDGQQASHDGVGQYYIAGLAYSDGTQLGATQLYIATGTISIQGIYAASLTAVSSVDTAATAATSLNQAGMLWLRVYDTGANPASGACVTWEISADGTNWRTFVVTDRWPGLDLSVATRIGPMMGCDDSAVRMHIFHFSVASGAPA